MAWRFAEERPTWLHHMLLLTTQQTAPPRSIRTNVGDDRWRRKALRGGRRSKEELRSLVPLDIDVKQGPHYCNMKLVLDAVGIREASTEEVAAINAAFARLEAKRGETKGAEGLLG